MNSIIELVKEIEQRPAMYIGKCSIHCLKSFFVGLSLNPNGFDDQKVLSEFQDWIEQKYKVRTAHSWADILNFYSNDEFDALNLFFSEFNTFISERI